MSTIIRSRRSPAGVRHFRHRTSRYACGLLLATASLGSPLLVRADVSTPEMDVAAFFDGVPEFVSNDDAECTDTDTGVAYVENRLVASGPVSPSALRTAVHAAVTARSGPPPVGRSWVSGIEEIRFPTVPGAGPAQRLYQVDLVPVPNPEGHDLLELSRQISGDSTTLEVSPDHGLVPAGPISQFWPNGFPRPAPGLDPARDANPGGDPAGTGVKIAIYDTGLAQPKDPSELPQITRMRPADTDVTDRDGDGIAYSLVAGHALAMSGVIQTLVPGADIEVARIADEGVATDTTTVMRIAASLRSTPIGDWPHVIVLAFGSPACLADPSDTGAGYLAPVGLRHAVDVIEALADQRPGGMIVVASAGNRGETRPYYPAAFDNVVGVGALDLSVDTDGNPWTAASGTGVVAAFSNSGGWVDAWGPGVDLPTTHLDEQWLGDEPDAPYLKGYAFVDGTSFSAPVVGSMIADQASRFGSDVRCAWLELEAAAMRPFAANGVGRPHGAAIVLDTFDGVPPAATGSVVDPTC